MSDTLLTPIEIGLTAAIVAIEDNEPLILTASSTVYHTGIYLGNGWTINSHGSGAGVTIDYMGANAGWFRDAFAFGWRVMPKGV